MEIASQIFVGGIIAGLLFLFLVVIIFSQEVE